MGSTFSLYLQIQQHLLERITSDDYPMHYQIPPEELLARNFGVSRMIDNQAIRELVQQGYLVHQPGLGTFVTDHQAESSLLDVTNIDEEVRRLAFTSATAACWKANPARLAATRPPP
ncbi:GntR family transcriptional regulator [Halomonas sp. M20]|uniref:GntR family transcriptional regulator n=1 Tax=Halomonas sp. M20 TaxID=2763264 RepID=UPI001D0B0EE1|nr:GntR family transcriptional regulator [Halomonas sp. M20]